MKRIGAVPSRRTRASLSPSIHTLTPTAARSDSTICVAALAVREVTCMGVVLRLSVLNLRQYRESFLPAYRAAESGRGFTAFAQTRVSPFFGRHQ